MRIIPELYVEGRKLDLTSVGNTLLSFVHDDKNSFFDRGTSFSLPLFLPGTANNNEALGFIFEIGNRKFYDSTSSNIGYNFNAAKSASCYIFYGGLRSFKGVIRLNEIVVSNGVIEYDVQLFGELSSFVYQLGNRKIEDLDFSSHDHVYSVANILASWDDISGSGYYYPLIDYGGYSSLKHDWDVRTFRPAIYVKEIIEKIFEGTTFTFDCDLFETERFKSLIIPHNQKKLQAPINQLLSAERSDPNYWLYIATLQTRMLEWTTVTASSLVTSTFSNSRFTYTGVDPITLHIVWDLTGEYAGELTGFTLSVKKNGTIIAGTSLVLPLSGSTSADPYQWTGAIDITVSQNDYIEFNTEADNPISNADFLKVLSGSLNITSNTATVADILLGETIHMNQILPKGIRQIEFISSLVKLFNLYVIEDPWGSNHLIITPYPDYYDTDPASFLDWTEKLDRSNYKIVPMSKLTARFYEYKYKDDSDFFNDLYKKRYNESYGSRIYDSEFEFANDKEGIEILFSGTPLVGYTGEEKVYSTILKLNNDVEEQVDSNIRILQAKKITGVTSWDIKDSTTVLTSVTAYGYAGHLNDPDAPTNDLNFGATKELFFPLAIGDLSNNQFNVYHSPYMAEITDKDSKMLVGDFKLNHLDIHNLDLSKLVYIDGNLFRINKISDYDPFDENTCKVELVSVINTDYTVSDSVEDQDPLLYVYEASGGETEISNTILAGKIILMVIRQTKGMIWYEAKGGNDDSICYRYHNTGKLPLFIPAIAGEVFQIIYK